MPASYRIDAERRIIFSKAQGTLTADDLLEHHRRLTSDPGFDRTFNQLWDFSAVEVDDVPTETIRMLARQRSFDAGARRAMVGSTDVQYGLLRMFEIQKEGAAEEIRVFRDLGEARAWLGLD